MDTLPESGVLLTIAQIAATFVGFSTVYFVFSGDKSNVQRRHFLRSVADTGLATVFGCLLPLFVIGIASDPALTWRLTAALFGVIWVVGWTMDSMKYWKRGMTASFTGKVHSPDNFLNIIGIALLAWTAITAPPYAGTLYVIAVTLLLSVSAGCFVAGAFIGQEQSE